MGGVIGLDAADLRLLGDVVAADSLELLLDDLDGLVDAARDPRAGAVEVKLGPLERRER